MQSKERRRVRGRCNRKEGRREMRGCKRRRRRGWEEEEGRRRRGGGGEEEEGRRMGG